MTDVTEADIAFAVFLATVTEADLTDWEYRLYRYHQLLGNRA